MGVYLETKPFTMQEKNSQQVTFSDRKRVVKGKGREEKSNLSLHSAYIGDIALWLPT